MIMSIKKSECQITFERAFTNTQGDINFGKRAKTSVPAFAIDSNRINEFNNVNYFKISGLWLVRRIELWSRLRRGLSQ